MTADLMNLEKGDKRVEFWNTALKQGERTVRLSLKFAKLVPGFRELDMDDQVSLFQGKFPLIDVGVFNIDKHCC